jgi:hypothetical protein
LAESFPGQRIPDAAIELEMNMSDQVLALLTTQDGTVGGLLKRGERLPEWFVEEVKAGRRTTASQKRIEWDSLSPSKKKQLLKSVLTARNQDFNKNRVIYGLKVREKATLHFDGPTLFMGRQYAAGAHEVRLDGILLPYVEAKGHKSAKNGSGVELHARNSGGAGNLSIDARTLQRGAGIPVTHQHGHVVAPTFIGAIPDNPDLEAAIKGDYVRRANLVAEMLGIVEDRQRIWTKSNGDISFFGSFRASAIEEITYTLERVARGDAPDVGDQFKLGSVGVRFQDKYDAPGLWGLEARTITSELDPEIARALLDAIQYGMTKGDYGLTAQQIEHWMGIPLGGPGRAVAAGWYNQPLGSLIDRLPESIGTLMKSRTNRKPRELFESLVREHQEVKMLLFDWARDTVVFLDPVLAERIPPQQERAISRLLDLKYPMSKRAERKAINAIMRDFLVDSGLYDAHLGAMGMQRVPKNPRGPRI